MKILKIVGLTMILSAGIAKAKPAVICQDGKAYIRDVTWDTGCVYPSTPFFKLLSLESDSPEKGKISIEMDYTFPKKNPNCDNPRGMPHYFNLVLPVDQGSWEIEIAGEGKTLLNFYPTCRIL